MYLFFCRLYPFSPQPSRSCLGPTCHLSTLNEHCIAGAGLPYHMMGGFVGPEKKTIVFEIRRSRSKFVSFAVFSE